MAQSAQSAPKSDLAGLSPPVGTVPHARTAHRGRIESKDALPAGDEFLPAAATVALAAPAGTCASEANSGRRVRLARAR